MQYSNLTRTSSSKRAETSDEITALTNKLGIHIHIENEFLRSVLISVKL